MVLEIEHVEIEPGVAVIRLAGKVTLGEESHQIETLVSDLLAKGYRKIIFDLSGVSHMDSTGIGRFISSFNQVMQAGGQMHMAGAQGMVRDGFRVTRLDTVFRFFPDVDAARQKLR